MILKQIQYLTSTKNKKLKCAKSTSTEDLIVNDQLELKYKCSEEETPKTNNYILLTCLLSNWRLLKKVSREKTERGEYYGQTT